MIPLCIILLSFSLIYFTLGLLTFLKSPDSGHPETTQPIAARSFSGYSEFAEKIGISCIISPNRENFGLYTFFCISLLQICSRRGHMVKDLGFRIVVSARNSFIVTHIHIVFYCHLMTPSIWVG